MIPIEVADLQMVCRKVFHASDQVTLEPETQDLVRRDVGAGQVFVGHLDEIDSGMKKKTFQNCDQRT